MKQPKDIKTLTSYMQFGEAMDRETKLCARKELAGSLAEILKREILAAADPGEPGEYRLRVMYTLDFEKVR